MVLILRRITNIILMMFSCRFLSVRKVANKRSFSRHASFEQICEVATQERNRLYFESKSQPSSPIKTKRKFEIKEFFIKN